MGKKKRVFSRYNFLVLMTVIIFGVLASRLYYLQIVKAEYYKDIQDNKSTTEIQQLAPRGEILDKNGLKLATNGEKYVLTFMETEKSKLYFYQTMDKVFKILDENKEIQKDDFELKVNPYSLQLKTEDNDVRKKLELRFKKDRGLDYKIKSNIFKSSKGDLTDSDTGVLEELLLAVTPEETFQYLVDFYGITPEGIFKNYIELYKTNPSEALYIIRANYTVSSIEEVKTLLDQYLKDSKNSKALLTELIDKCGVAKKALKVEEQRRYMVVKDALKMQSYSGCSQVVISSDIKRDTAFLISQQLSDLPGIDIDIQPVRTYPYAELGSGIVGYISKINSNDDKYVEKGYDASTDYIGSMGIESSFEDVLKGSKGGEVVRLNSQGRVTEELGVREAYPGSTVQLTIDSNVQYAAETALDKVMKELQARGRVRDVDTSNATRGAAVAIDVNTGAVLALASRPGFDPNDFVNPAGLSDNLYKKYFYPDLDAYGKTRGLSQALIDKIFPIIDKAKGARKDAYDFVPRPLYNYATYSLIPPGSTFKPMTAIAGLEAGVISSKTTVNDNARFEDGHNFKTDFPNDGANGVVDVIKALGVSSNPFFMRVGQLLRDNYGDDKLAEYAWKFGLGIDPNSKTAATTGIEINENFGQVFNSVSIKNRSADSYLLNVMSTLRSGKGYRGNTFTAIDLNITGDESKELRELKQSIRNQVKDSVKTGNRADAAYKDLLTKLVSLDPLYSGKTISKNEITTIAYEIEHITVDQGNYETKIGANMYNASIGQGMNQFTPLQLANYVATIVNGGSRYKVHLVDKIIDPNGKVIQQIQPTVLETTGIKQSTIDLVKAGMKEVVGTGTASGAFTGFPIPTAGKTGTATFQNNQDELGRAPYGLYVGFAPVQNPKIAVAVVIFDGGYGSNVAPIAKAMYEAYFKAELDAMNYKYDNDVVAKPVHSN